MHGFETYTPKLIEFSNHFTAIINVSNGHSPSPFGVLLPWPFQQFCILSFKKLNKAIRRLGINLYTGAVGKCINYSIGFKSLKILNLRKGKGCLLPAGDVIQDWRKIQRCCEGEC